MNDDDMIRRGDAMRVARDAARQIISGAVACHGEMYEHEMQEAADQVADALAALPAAQVAVKPGVIERAVWTAMVWAGTVSTNGRWTLPEYTDRGNSNAEVECRAAAARIRAALDVAPAPDEWRDVVEWTDSGVKTLLDWYAGGAHPGGEFSRIGLRREMPDGTVLYRSYTADGPWSDTGANPAAPASDVAGLVEALREARDYVPDHLEYITARIDAALAAWEKANG